MKKGEMIFGAFVLICIFITMGAVNAIENNTDVFQTEVSDNLEITNDIEKLCQVNTDASEDNDEGLLSGNNEEILEVADDTESLSSNNEEILEVADDTDLLSRSNEEISDIANNSGILGSYNTYYDFDAEYDDSVQECAHEYTFYTQHYGKQVLYVEAKDVKKLAIAHANHKYKEITYETVNKQKVTIKYTKTFKRKFKEMGNTIKLTNKKWKKIIKKVKKLKKKGWKITKKTKNTIKLIKKVKKRCKIYFDLINYPEGYELPYTGYNTQYIRIYTKYYPDLDEDVAGVSW